ncbi:MAG TPA: choice-of-anchor K domain-containing protein [Anaerohalosphaeraceae bacterium]|nr:choice-of-anchor K domain-containing protein [Anaerohalosphaeraceae bacterium]
MIDRCLFESNCAKQTGGAIYNVMSDLVFKSCSFYGNSDLGLLPVFPNAFLLSVLPDWFWESSFGGNGQYIEQDLSVVSPNYPGQTGGTEYQIRWGQVTNNVTENKSGLGFTGYAPPIRSIIVNEPFEIGRLRHFNNPVGSGSPPSRVDIEIALALECGSQLSQSFTFSLAINETANTSNLSDPAAKNWADRDFITFPVSYPSQLIEIEGRLYTLKIIGFQTEQGQLVSQFESPEHGTNTVYLWAQIAPPPADGAITNLASNIWVGNSVFVGNTSCSYGAALSNWACDNVFVGNSTITANHGEFCGGIYNHESNLTLVNSILWGNTDVDGLSVGDKQFYNSGNGTVSVTYSCIQDANSLDMVVYPGTGNIDNAPLFLITPIDGGDGWGIGNNDEYGNLYLSENSPCIDAGTNAPVLTYTILTDIFGHVRRFDCPTITDTGSGTAPIVDMGAYEHGNNSAPVAVQDQASTSEGTVVVIDVLANDSDVDGDAISIDSISSGPSHGTAVINGNTIVYTPAPGYFGSDAFNYRITDGVLTSNHAAVYIQITSNHVYVNAGPNQTIQLPNNKVYLDGVIQGLPSGSSPAWRVLSQPTGGAVVFDSSVSVMPAGYDVWDSWAGFSLPGMYVLELGVAIAGQEYKDQVVVNVRPGIISGNLPPQVEAWATPSEITLPQGTTLNWTISDDGVSRGELTQEWSVVSGPTSGRVTFGPYASLSRSTTVSFSMDGNYILSLEASDGIDKTEELVYVTVSPDPAYENNTPPVAEAGENQTVVLPVNQPYAFTHFGASVGDETATGILNIQWSVLKSVYVDKEGIEREGNSAVAIADPAELNPRLTFFRPGQYTLQLKADDGQLSAADTVVFTVYDGNPESSPVQIEAGPDQTITLPAPAMLSEATVIETATGLPYPIEGLDINWRKVRGPGEVTFNQDGGSGNGTQELNPEAVFSKPGDYDLELQVSTGDMKLADQIRIKVYPGTRLATAAHSSYFINEYGQVWAAGSNAYAQLGNGTSGYDPNEKHDYVGRGKWYDHYTYSPVMAGEQKLQTNKDVLTNICSIGGGWASSYALDYNGDVWSWGNNSFGQLGIGRENLRVDTPVNEPRKVLAGEQLSASGYLEDIVAISTATLSEHALAVDKQGGVWAWGYNYDGVLGNGYDEAMAYWENDDDYKNKRRRRFPWDPFVFSFIESTPVHVGSSSLVLDAYINFDSSVCYGSDDFCIQYDISGNRRELTSIGSVSNTGYGNELFDYVYETVDFPSTEVQNNTCAVFNSINGKGFLVFDPNYYGIIENNPRTISFWIKNDEADIYSRGTVLSWGDPDIMGGLWEVRIESGHVVIYVDKLHCIQTEETLESNSWNHIVVVFPENGSLLSHTRIYLTQEDDLLCPPASTICVTEQVVSTVRYESCRIGASQNNDPNYNYYGYLDELQIYKVELLQEEIDHIHRCPYYTAPLKNIVSVSAGWVHSLALEKNNGTPSCRGRVYAWGDSTAGELGQGDDPVNRKVLPCCVKTGEQNDPSGYLSNIVAISAGCDHSLALEKYTEDANDIYSGRVLAWGWDYVGMFTYFNRNTEYQFPGGNTNSAYYGGRIGRGSTSNDNSFIFPSPVYVYGPDLDGDGVHDPNEEGYLQHIVAISAGESHSMALDKDGHVWVWGDNTHGQLGVGDRSLINSGFPVMVKAPQDYNNPAGHLGDPEWGKIIAIMAGPWHCLALDEYGEVWAWGASWAIGCGEPGYHGTFLPQKISYSQKVKRVSSGTETWYGDIRAAVDESVEGDEIVVYPGVYNGFTLRGYSHADPNGRTDPNVIIRSWNADSPSEQGRPIIRGIGTVIDISNNHSIVKGFAISGGQYGIKLHNSNSLVCNNIIKKNTETGICCTGNSNAVIANNIIGDNSLECKVGIECKDISSVTLFSNLIKCNLIGVKIESNDAELWNNTIVKNRDQGIYVYANPSSRPIIRNCIIWANGFDANQNIYPIDQLVDIDYCAIQKGQFVPPSLFHKAVVDNDGSAFADTNEWHYFPLNPAFLDREITDPNEDDDPNNCINEGCPLPDEPWVQYLAKWDIESKRRIADSKIDLGANEYIAYAVEAGQNKAVGISEIVFMDDAAVYKEGSVCIDIWPYGVQWEVLERPAGSNFFIPGQLAGLINPGWRLDIPGKYVFRINLYDAQGAWVDGDVVTVMAELNVKIDPVSDVQLQYDADTGQVKAEIELQGSLRGIDPQAVQTLWLVPTEAILGPVSDLTELDGAYHTSTSALFYLPGEYEIRLQLLNIQGDMIAEDVIMVDVAELAYQADAGPDITIPWQNTPVSIPLSGRLLPYSVGNESYLWKYIEGPAGGLRFNPGSNDGLTESSIHNPQATFTIPGIYHIQFAVINPSGCFVDDLVVIIDTKEIPLAAEAGADLNCVLNNNVAAVVPQKAFVYPVEGVSVQWYDQSDLPIAGATSVNSTLTFTQPGVYHCKLKATRGQETAEDTVQITVHPQPVDSLLIRTGNYGPVLAGRAFTLEDAYVWYSQNTPLTVEWSSDDEQHVLFYPSSDEGKTSDALQPTVLFAAGLAKSYELTLKVSQGSAPLGSASVTIQAVTGDDPGLNSDTTPPILTLTPGLLDDANKLHTMPESTAVIKTGSVALDIYVLDAGSRLKSVKIEDTCNSITTLVKNFDFSDTDPEYPSQMQVTWYLEIMKLTTGSHSVKVTAADRANNITEQTVAFTVGRDVDNPTGKPFAWISNLEPARVNIGKLGEQVVLPEITDGLYEVKGLACHPNSNQSVEFKFALYDEAVVGYVPESWATLNGQNPPYPDYLIQNLKVENPDLTKSTADHSYYAGPIGLCNDANSLGYDNKSFGQLDLTGVENGTYCLLLTVRSRPDENTAFAYSYVYKKIKLNSPLKIGNLKFSQEDVAIDVGGVPLRVVRTYNSFQKDKNSEFGYGWSYSIANMDIQLNETRQPMQVYMGSSTMSVRVGDNYDRDVTLTLPDGRRVTFAFGLELKKPDLYNGQMQYYVAKYTSPEGVSARLETLSEERLTLLNTWENQDTASFVSGSGNYSDPGFYEFEGYRLVMEDGTSYVFRRSYVGDDFVEYGNSVAYVEPKGPLYLSEIGLPTGERIDLNVNLSNGRIGQIDSAGVEHIDLLGAPTKAIKIGYDTRGRIVEVWGPGEQGGALPTVKYAYDTAGNLWKVSKLVKPNADPNSRYEILTYSYEDDNHTLSDHYVTAIIDPRGLQPIRYEYDTVGRLIATVDAKGNRIAITHDVSSRQEIVTDRAGNPTIYEYDKRGNVLSVTDSANKVTRYTYDSENRFGPDRQLSVTTRVPNPDDLSQLVDAVTLYDYAYYEDSSQPEYGRLNVQTVIDPAKNKTETTYDANGNVTKVTQYKYDAEEDVYVEVLTTRTAYIRTDDGSGPKNLPYFTGATTGEGSAMVWHSISLTRYDASGRILESVQVKMDNSIEEQLLNSDKTPKSYSELFNNWSANTTNSSVTSYTYFEYATDSGYSPDQPYSVTGPDGQTQYFWYDADNHQLASWTLWDDAATGADPDKRILTYNQPDVQGRTIATYRVVQDLTAAGTPMDVAVLLAHINEQQTGVEAVALSYSDYNSIGKVNTSIDENGILTQYHYDETGNLVETLVYSSFAAYQTHYTSYLTTGNTTGILTISRTLYDTEGRAIVAVGPYDPADTEHSPVGTETVYDNLGRVEQTRRWADVDILFDYVMKSGENTLLYVTLAQDRVAGGAWTSTPGQMQLAWTSDGKVPVITANLAWWQAGPLSYSRTEYDAAGRVWKSYSLNESNAEICTAEYRYDTAGRQIRTISLPNDTTGKRSETVTVYDGTRRQSVTDGLGHTTSFDYDALGRVIMTTHPASLVEGSGITPVETYSHVGYDSLGRKWWESAKTCQDDREHVDLTTETNDWKLRRKVFGYDAAGRLTSVTLPGVQDPENNNTWTAPVYSYIYDDYGNQAGVVDPKGRVTVSVYDHLNRLVRTYQPFAYTGDLTAAAIYAAAAAANVPYEATSYDEHDRVLTQTDCEGHYTVFAYDAFGRVEYERHYVNAAACNTGLPSCNANPQIYTTYDTLGRKWFVTVQSFDSSGQAVDIAQQWGYSYDDEGRTQQVTSPQGTITYGYSDITGRKTLTCKDLTDFVTRYGYDELGRLDAVQVMMRGGVDVSSEGMTRYGYDLVGNLDWVQLPNGNYTQYKYDSQNRLRDQITYQNGVGSTVLSHYTYSVYADGQRSQSSQTQNGSTTTYLWQYDSLNRVTEERLIGVCTYQRIYDLTGNVKTYTATEDGQPSIPTSYLYNDQDQLLTETSPAGTISYGYDDNGSLTSKTTSGGTESYSYDLQGRLRTYTPATGPSVLYAYDPDGQRIGKTAVTGITEYVVDPYNPTGYSQVLAETTGMITTCYIHGSDVIGQSVNGASPQYFLYDGHGSVRQLTMSTGLLVGGQDFWYDAWGNELTENTPLTNYLYCGEQRDGETGLYYLRARMYDPQTGRFTSRDPFAGNGTDPQSLHKYLYCHANPVNGIDPSGELTLNEVVTVTTIIGTFIGVACGPIHHGMEKVRNDMAITDRTSGITFLDKGVQTQRRRDLQEIDNPDLLNMTDEFYHDLGQSQKRITYYNQRMTLTALQGIDSAIHANQIAGAAIGIIGGISSTASQASIYWPNKIPHPSNGWEHWSTIKWNVTWRAMTKSDIEKIYVHHALSTSTNRFTNSLLKPDWIEITTSGKYRIFEIESPSQIYKYNSFLEKGWQYKKILGDKLEYFDVIKIGQQVP